MMKVKYLGVTFFGTVNIHSDRAIIWILRF